MPRTNRSGAATRVRILDAAAAVLAADGAAGFTLQSVAQKAGIHYGNLTHHYPTRDVLIDAMFAHLVEHYRRSFREMTERAQASGASVRNIVTWLLDDAVTDGTAGVFLQLWAMAAHLPRIAEGMAQLYDQAVDAFMEAFEIDPRAASARRLRDSLFLLGTVIEGSSAIFWTRDGSGAAFRASVQPVAVDTLSRLIEDALSEARHMPVVTR